MGTGGMGLQSGGGGGGKISTSNECSPNNPMIFK